MAKEYDVSVDEASRILRNYNQRVTLQRLIILQIILRHGGHIPAEEIYRYIATEHPYIDKSTVYRILASLVEAGIITHISAQAGALYELATIDRHLHIACVTCGHLVEIAKEDERFIEEHIFAKYGFSLAFDQGALPGICAGCNSDPGCNVHTAQEPGQHAHPLPAKAKAE